MPETTTDLNGQVPTAITAYGRQTKMSHPDGSSNSTVYLYEGNW